MSGPQVPNRVYLHVGVPKSGTTFLQGALGQNRKALRGAGFLYPSGGNEPMFRAALDVRDDHQGWGRERSDVDGAWERLCRKARNHDGTTVISHELLAAATPEQVASARSMLAGKDVHVIVTARDLARQLTAEWQEGVKHGRTVSFREFRTRIMSSDRGHEHARRFWAAQDLPEVITRWSVGLPPENVHVVCCPPPTTDPTELWHRFADAVGFDADAFDPTRPRSANTSLGVVQIDLLRRVNAALAGRLVQPEYGRVVKQYFTKQLLAQHRSARPELPDDLYDGLVSVGRRWVTEIDRAGYQIHGDLSELIPSPPANPYPNPDDVDSLAEVSTAAGVVADLLVEVDRLRSKVECLEANQDSSRSAVGRVRRALKDRLGPASARPTGDPAR